MSKDARQLIEGIVYDTYKYDALNAGYTSARFRKLISGATDKELLEVIDRI